ncbi:MAG: T9SS type A sorting domain-containing protein, partial [Psychroflexus sp.]|nr:T9SS type A sorting domain-containing protein [Psychroflexus sp.]
DDTGVTSIIDPSSGSGLSINENVTIEISNFGSATQTSIPVFYSVNGGTPVQETYTGSIALGNTDTYTFSQQADLSGLGTYDFIAGTELPTDADTTNDDITKTVNNTSCIPESNCDDFNDGVTQIQLADQDIITNCSDTGYSDDTNIVFSFNFADNPFSGTLQMGFDDSEFALWIDFNDNGIFESNELVANDFVQNAGTDFNFTVNFNDFPNATEGIHLMRLRGEDQSTSGDVTDPCDDLAFGRTNDYTADITSLGTNDNTFSDGSELILVDEGRDQFQVLLNTSKVTNTLLLSVYDINGKQLLQYPLDNETGNGYEYNLDMSHVSSGVYLVRLRDENYSSTKRLIVK